MNNKYGKLPKAPPQPDILKLRTHRPMKVDKSHSPGFTRCIKTRVAIPVMAVASARGLHPAS